MRDGLNEKLSRDCVSKASAMPEVAAPLQHDNTRGTLRSNPPTDKLVQRSIPKPVEAGQYVLDYNVTEHLFKIRWNM